MKFRGIFLNSLLFLLLIVACIFLYYNLSSPLAMYPNDAKKALKEARFDHVVDVRTDMEWNAGHYPLAIHIPLKDVSEILPKRIPDTKSRILFYCNTTTRARMAAETAQMGGYKNVRYLVGIHTNLLD
jgi:rhodanese-related sulfurtransferase